MSLTDTEPATCHPWDADLACCEDEWGEYPEETQNRALSLAWSSFKNLTAGRLGACPVVMRPCLYQDPCAECFGPSWMTPYVDEHGRWKNALCRVEGSCSCCDMCEIIMPGTVAEIVSINMDGFTVAKDIFRIDNGNKLVRQDGRCWPNCQNLTAPSGAAGTLTITYIPGVRPTASHLAAVGLLACEFAKACTGAKCRLPAGVTSVVRNGVSMEMGSKLWENLTGIREVDAAILDINPNGLKVPPKVWSPDLASAKHRITTWDGRP